MCVQYYVANVVNTSTENANAILAGKAKSAHSATTNVKFQTATATATASTENARASEDIKGSFALMLTALIRPAPPMASASKAPVSARRGGRAWIVRPWIRMRSNVSRTAPVTELSMSIRKLARVTPGGPGMTVLKVMFVAKTYFS